MNRRSFLQCVGGIAAYLALPKSLHPAVPLPTKQHTLVSHELPAYGINGIIPHGTIQIYFASYEDGVYFIQWDAEKQMWLRCDGSNNTVNLTGCIVYPSYV
jgi:hypothetical protein